MKICFFRHSLWNRGGDKMVIQYANHLTSRGHDVVISSNIVDTLFDVQSKIENISCTSTKTGTIANALFTKRDYDVIVADIIMMIFLLSFRNKRRLLYFAQDYDESYYKGLLMKMLIRGVYYYCLKLLKIPVIAVSEELGQLLRKRFSADVTVVTNGVDTDVFYPDRDNEYLSLKNKSRVILVFARSDYRKGFDIAVKVLSKFRNRIEKGDISIWTIGEDIDVPFTVNKFGFVSPGRLRKILSCADVLLYPSRHEGLPLFVLEALACGCLVVATDAVEILKKIDRSLLCEAEDVECLSRNVEIGLKDRALQNQVIKEGYTFVENNSLSESKRKFALALDNLSEVKKRRLQ